MASATVTLRRGSNPAVYVRADLSLRVAPTTRVESRLGGAPRELYLPDGSPHASYTPAEATLLSGALYALRKLGAVHGSAGPGDGRYVLTVDRLSGVFQPEDVEGFAHAGVIGVARMTGRPDITAGDPLGDWRLEECVLSA